MTTLRMTTSGESHGPAETCIVEGIPAGLSLDPLRSIAILSGDRADMAVAGRMAIEKDRCRFLGGVRHGHTLGSPICVVVENTDFQQLVHSDVARAPCLPRTVVRRICGRWRCLGPVTPTWEA